MWKITWAFCLMFWILELGLLTRSCSKWKHLGKDESLSWLGGECAPWMKWQKRAKEIARRWCSIIVQICFLKLWRLNILVKRAIQTTNGNWIDPLNRVQILIQPFIIRSVSKFLNVSESQFPNRERYEVYEVVTT